MMNNENQISKKTKLFGYIGEHAGVSRFSALLNKAFKINSDDAMMIPMNIREDDFFFTLSNMKKSHVDGAIISNEYVTSFLDLRLYQNEEEAKKELKEGLYNDFFISLATNYLNSCDSNAILFCMGDNDTYGPVNGVMMSRAEVLAAVHVGCSAPVQVVYCCNGAMYEAR